nr:MAG TPA: hypothetical protein [Caudoviricetes sp.]
MPFLFASAFTFSNNNIILLPRKSSVYIDFSLKVFYYSFTETL